MKQIQSPSDINEFVDSFDTFLLDMDGVLWQGSTLLPGVEKTLEYLRSKGKRLLFVTNNSTKSRESYLQKLDSLNLDTSFKPTAPEQRHDKIFGSSYATAIYLSTILKFPEDKKVYVLGQQGIVDELENVGIRCCGGMDDRENIKTPEELDAITPDPEVGAVVCGFDMDINYKKLAKAFTYLRNPDCLFIATNTDTTFPTHGTLFPGTGSLIAPLVTATNRTPIVLGKPHKTMLDCILAKYHLNPNRTCMIGDRLDTDIQFGISGNIKTALVLTGVTKELQLHDAKNKIHPDFVMDGLGLIGVLAEGGVISGGKK
ncbi:HAD-like domain-containing protein [Paraphysoderma sedebokerense]|nr:HAD-like domain-containing protein [Paraphysoderma sedebokerense]